MQQMVWVGVGNSLFSLSPIPYNARQQHCAGPRTSTLPDFHKKAATQGKVLKIFNQKMLSFGPLPIAMRKREVKEGPPTRIMPKGHGLWSSNGQCSTWCTRAFILRRGKRFDSQANIQQALNLLEVRLKVVFALRAKVVNLWSKVKRKLYICKCRRPEKNVFVWRYCRAERSHAMNIKAIITLQWCGWRVVKNLCTSFILLR